MQLSYTHKLTIFALIYGFFLVNWIDLVVVKHNVHSFYSIWIILMYFAPFLALLLQSWSNWKSFLWLGLLVSLMNDCFYYFAGYVMGFNPSLQTFPHWLYLQLGFGGSKHLWTMHLGLIQIRITSLLMGISIYLRIALVILLSSGDRLINQYRRNILIAPTPENSLPTDRLTEQ